MVKVGVFKASEVARRIQTGVGHEKEDSERGDGDGEVVLAPGW
jgi:hypothetical protein